MSNYSLQGAALTQSTWREWIAFSSWCTPGVIHTTRSCCIFHKPYHMCHQKQNGFMYPRMCHLPGVLNELHIHSEPDYDRELWFQYHTLNVYVTFLASPGVYGTTSTARCSFVQRSMVTLQAILHPQQLFRVQFPGPSTDDFSLQETARHPTGQNHNIRMNGIRM